MVERYQQTARTVNRTLEDIRMGTVCLFADPPIRYALALQLVAAIAGIGETLVNVPTQTLIADSPRRGFANVSMLKFKGECMAHTLPGVISGGR
jgi:hypothetical protein